jgi:hypothetical protein
MATALVPGSIDRLRHAFRRRPTASTCMTCSFGLLDRSEPRAQPTGLLGVTVTVRWIPLVPAAYGMWMARPARTTMLRPGGDRSQLDRRVRLVLGEPLLVGKSLEGLAAAGWGDWNSDSPIEWRPGRSAVGGFTCGSLLPVVTARARYACLPAGLAWTQLTVRSD